jgi:hypothetical protein
VADGGELVIEWAVEYAGESEPEAWIRWSADDGASWHPIAIGLRGGEAAATSGRRKRTATIGLRGGEAALDLSAVPSGKAIVQLLAHDGFSTAVSESVAIEIPARPPSVAILHPQDGRTLQAGGTLRLWGAATSGAGEPVNPERTRWLIDGQEVARGLDAWVVAPPEGDHECTLVVEDGEPVTRTSRFRTVGPPPESRSPGGAAQRTAK